MVPSVRPPLRRPAGVTGAALPDPLGAVVARLRCPVCAEPVELTGDRPRVLACPRGHRFDVARQGHVVLVPGGSKLRSDTTDMVGARDRVLASGMYDPLRAALVDAAVVDAAVVDDAAAQVPGLVVDLGAGTGAWTAAVLDALPERHGVALELSVPALRRAARAHPRLAAVGADLTRPLPLADGCVGLALAVFAPLPDLEELGRVSVPGSRLIVVTPTPAHLAGLRERLGLLDVPASKPERLVRRLFPTWEPVGQVEVVAPVTFGPALAADVVAMGPNAWHADVARVTGLAALPARLHDTLAVTVTTLSRR